MSAPTIRVQAERCETCIFQPGNLMNLRRGRVAQMVQETIAVDGCIPCHELLDRPGGRLVSGPGSGAVCRGFFDKHGDAVFPLRLARSMGAIEEVGE